MEETISFLAHGLASKRAVCPQSDHELWNLMIYTWFAAHILNLCYRSSNW